MGFIYVCSFENIKGIKIGITSYNPKVREHSLSLNNNDKCTMEFYIKTPLYKVVETSIHSQLKNHEIKREFFNITKGKAIQICKESVSRIENNFQEKIKLKSFNPKRKLRKIDTEGIYKMMEDFRQGKDYKYLIDKYGLSRQQIHNYVYKFCLY